MAHITSSMTLANLCKSVKDHRDFIDKNAGQIASRQRYSNFQDLTAAGVNNRASELSREIPIVEQSVRHNQKVWNKLLATDSQLGVMYDDISLALSEMVQYRPNASNNRYIPILQNSIHAHLKTMEDALNYRVAGEAIFGGLAVFDTPVKDIVNQSNVINGEVTINYINDAIGSQEIEYDHLTSQIAVQGNLVAGDRVFANIIGSFHKILDKIKNNDDISKEVDLLGQHQKDLSSKRSMVGNNMKVVEDANEILRNQLRFFEKSFSDTMMVDDSELVDVFSQIKRFEVNLNFLYDIISRVSSLSLIDHL